MYANLHASHIQCLNFNIVQNVPLESKEVATMFVAVPNALAKHSENEKSPSPTSKIF